MKRDDGFLFDVGDRVVFTERAARGWELDGDTPEQTQDSYTITRRDRAYRRGNVYFLDGGFPYPVDEGDLEPAEAAQERLDAVERGRAVERAIMRGTFARAARGNAQHALLRRAMLTGSFWRGELGENALANEEVG